VDFELLVLHVLILRQIDAICINQMDDAERTKQILRMQSIYSGAKSVVVALESAVIAEADVLLRALDLFQANLPLLYAGGDMTEELADIVRSSLFSVALRGFCNDEYWKRIWIIQEVAIGNDIKLLINDKLIQQSQIWRLLSWLEIQFGDVVGKNINLLTSIRKIRDSYQNNTEAESRGMLKMLEMTINSRCGRIEDRVFGLMGLMLDALKYLPEPDYERELADTTIAICRAYIEKQSLDILFLAPHCHPHSSLPTWCPDFFRFDRYLPDRRILRHLIEQTKDSEFSPEVSYRGNTLVTRAALLGTIRSLGSTDKVSDDYPKHDPTWARELGSLSLAEELVLAAEATDHPGDERMIAIFGNTLIRLFDPQYGPVEADHIDFANVKWVCNNRAFFTGALTLGEHATKLNHPIWSYGLNAWRSIYFEDINFNKMFSRFAGPFKRGMRLMCFEYGQKACIGWAAANAQLYDQIFYIPGCSRPVLLRKNTHDDYQVIGEAIVPLFSERLKQSHMQEIAIG
jgi:hypothetical protein